MNNKEFTSELSRRLGYTLKDTSELVASLLADMTRQLEEGNIISIQGFGHCGRMVLAVTLHNLPEGMVVGLAAALALHGDADAQDGHSC